MSVSELDGIIRAAILALWDRSVRSHREFMAERGFLPYWRVMVEVENSELLRKYGLESPLTVGGYEA